MTLATPKLGIPKPLGGENATRLSITQMIDKVDEQSAQEPFLVVPGTLSYAAGNLTIPVGPGKVRFPGVFINKGATNVVIPAPGTSTTYYLYIKSDNTYVYDTSGATVAGQRLLWSFQTANPVAAGTTVIVDLRENMPSTDLIAHAPSHQPGGVDAMAVDALAVVGSLRTLGSGATQAAAGDHIHGSSGYPPAGGGGGGTSLSIPKLYGFGPAF
jgi:hypothetical protein